jgi:hypothetical protein
LSIILRKIGFFFGDTNVAAPIFSKMFGFLLHMTPYTRPFHRLYHLPATDGGEVWDHVYFLPLPRIAGSVA